MLGCEQSVISTVNFQLRKKKKKKIKKNSLNLLLNFIWELSCRFLAPNVFLETFLVYRGHSISPGIRISSELYITLGETDQVPGNIYQLVCSCFSLFEVMLFTGNSVIISFRSSLGENYCKNMKHMLKHMAKNFSMWPKYKEKNQNWLPQIPQW